MLHFLPTNKNKFKSLLLLSVLLFLIIIFSLPFGPSGIELNLFTNITLFKDTINLRIYRILLAMITGGVLGITGSTLQALLKNKLADPFIIGVSGGAALGGSICIIISPESTATPIFSIIGSLISSFFICYIFLPKYSFKTENILLAGVAFNMFSSSMITLMRILLPANKTQSLLFWLVGSIQYITYANFFFIALVTLFGCIVLIRLSPLIEIISQGDDEAERLGVNVNKIKKIVYLVISIILGITIAYTGMIGFIGLIIPNILRIIFSSNQNILLPTSMFLGAIILILFDTLSRYSFFCFETEIPVGVLTSIFGTPIFLWMILKK